MLGATHAATVAFLHWQAAEASAIEPIKVDSEDRRIAATLEGRDEPLVVDADGRDIRRWERDEGKSLFVDGASAGMLAFIAWSAARRAGVYDGSWELFDSECVDAREVPDGDPTGPTPKDRTGG